MDLKLAVYNMEWMKDLFLQDGTPKQAANTDGSEEQNKLVERSGLLADVVREAKASGD